jgi:hypothetical protein
VSAPESDPESSVPPGTWDQPHALSQDAKLIRLVCQKLIAKGLGERPPPITTRAILALIDAHANDLADMQRAISQLEDVYSHITSGSLSKWNTDPIHIKQAHDDAIEQAYKEGQSDAREAAGASFVCETCGKPASIATAVNADREIVYSCKACFAARPDSE